MLGSIDEDFHAHIYFTAATRASALALREALAAHPDFCVDLQPVREQSIGPHPTPMFNAHLDRSNFADAILWLMQNHGPHSILIHPMTGDDLLDHTAHALWLGPALPLRLDRL